MTEQFSNTIAVPFAEAREYMAKHKNLDGEPAGASPITIRWLNKKNTYVNLGFEDSNKCTRVYSNQNSYGVTQADVDEVAEDIHKWYTGHNV